jgi:transcriptional regulator with XRE-family HTH domain
MTTSVRVGALLREWRQRRRLSQLALALDAEISARHLSFIETGRAQPSREMILHLAERLQVPLRQRNILLAAAGYAQSYPERKLDDPALAAVNRVVQMALAGPYPAMALNRHWEVLTANQGLTPLLAGVDPALLEPPVNVLRLTLHPSGLAPRILNSSEVRSHLLARLQQQIEGTADKFLIKLMQEMRSYPAADGLRDEQAHQAGISLPLNLSTDLGTLKLISTTMVFGGPLDITISELMIESLYPADEGSASILRRLSG